MRLLNYHLPRTKFSSLLDSCPEEIKHRYLQQINEQMHDGVDAYIANIANVSNNAKVAFLKIYEEFIDPQQKQKILLSIDDEVINEINKDITDLLKSECNIHELRSFTDKISDKFYKNDCYVQEMVKNAIIETILQIIPQVP